MNNSSPRSKHIDCTVTVTCDLTFTAVFNAKDSTGNSYTSVGRKVYLWYKDDSDKNNVDHCLTIQWVHRWGRRTVGL